MVTGDAWADASALYDREAEYEKRLPICECCGNPIQDEDVYDFDGDLICEECLLDYVRENFRKKTEEYMED